MLAHNYGTKWHCRIQSNSGIRGNGIVVTVTHNGCMNFRLLIISILLPSAGIPAGPDLSAPATISRIRDLRLQIARHDELYYRQNTQQISDAQYDALRKELSQLERAHPDLAKQAGEQLQAFGDDRSKGNREVRHVTPMLSLSKCYSLEDLDLFYDKLCSDLGAADLRLRMEPKIDGVAVSAVYENGHLKHVVSRGNGVTGSDLTQQIRITGCLPERLPDDHGGLPELVEFRGEAYIPVTTFTRLNAPNESSGRPIYASPRNLAAGTLRLADFSKIADRGLRVVIFSTGGWLPEETIPQTEQACRQLMEDWGIPVIQHTGVAFGKADLFYKIEQLSAHRSDWDYPADGIVVELENHQDRMRIGTGHAGPNWATAYKFPSPASPTVLREIIWQTGTSGRVTPVALFDPVVLDGRTIRRASLYSAAYVAENGFQAGDPVVVELRGHTIPVIRRIAEEQPYQDVGK